MNPCAPGARLLLLSHFPFLLILIIIVPSSLPFRIPPSSRLVQHCHLLAQHVGRTSFEAAKKELSAADAAAAADERSRLAVAARAALVMCDDTICTGGCAHGIMNGYLMALKAAVKSEDAQHVSNAQLAETLARGTDVRSTRAQLALNSRSTRAQLALVHWFIRSTQGGLRWPKNTEVKCSTWFTRCADRQTDRQTDVGGGERRL